MTDALFYLVSSFWLGALHAATPGHGKTIAAAYIVGVRGRPVDALVLGIFVTLSHTIGIVLVAVLATVGATWGVPQRVEAYLAAGTGLLVLAIGLVMLRTQSGGLFRSPPMAGGHHHDHDHEHGHDHAHPHDHEPHAHAREAGAPRVHRHGWGPAHSHAEEIERITRARPSLLVLLGLAIAGGPVAGTAPDQWVEVEGVLALRERDGDRLVTIVAERVSVVEEPRNPYLSALY